MMQDPGQEVVAGPYRLFEVQPASASVALPPGAAARLTGLVGPVRGARVVTGPYYQRRGTSYHLGLDLRAEEGTPVYASGPGQVISVTRGDYPKPYGLSTGDAAFRAQADQIRASGRVVHKCGTFATIRFDAPPSGRSSTISFCHLSSVDVRPGQRVALGDRIGATGNTGNSTGPHLHLTLNVDGIRGKVDPVAMMAWPEGLLYKSAEDTPQGTVRPWPGVASPASPAPAPVPVSAPPPPVAPVAVALPPSVPPLGDEPLQQVYLPGGATPSIYDPLPAAPPRQNMSLYLVAGAAGLGLLGVALLIRSQP